MKFPKYYILFDIDYTLLETIPLQKPAYNSMFMKTFGIDGNLDDVEYSGKMVADIISGVARKHGVADAVIGNRILYAQECLANNLEAILQQQKPVPPYILPGVPDVLFELKMHSLLGVLSGNPKIVAEVLLKWANLLNIFPIQTFGQEAQSRQQLIDISIRKFEKLYRQSLKQENIIMIGDSINDVFSAKASGIVAVGVTTGLHTKEQLFQDGADYVIESLKDLPDLLKNSLN